MVSTLSTPEILRLDELERKAWVYQAKGKVSGSPHLVRRAERLMTAAHKRASAEVEAHLTRWY